MKQNSYIIGVTGNIGSGKSTVCKIIKELGYPVVSADEKTEKSYEIAHEKLLAAFGEDILTNGKIDRTKLSQIVFGNILERNKLNEILHPIIVESIFSEAKSYGKVAFVEIPLLFEANLQNRCDEVWLVTASKEISISRVQSRDSISQADATKRLSSQIPDEKKVSMSHIIIHNVEGLEELKSKVECEIEKLEDRLG